MPVDDAGGRSVCSTAVDRPRHDARRRETSLGWTIQRRAVMPAYTFGGLVALHTFQHYSDRLQGSGILGEDPSSWGHDTSRNIVRPSSNRKEPLACDGNAHMSLP